MLDLDEAIDLQCRALELLHCGTPLQADVKWKIAEVYLTKFGVGGSNV